MSFSREDLLLYGITDGSFVGEHSLEDLVECALRGGVTMIQYREKHKTDEDFKEEAMKLLELCRTYEIPLIINDRVDLALEIGADGVHVGGEDMDPVKAREILGGDKILGVSAKTADQAQRAELAGADYIGSGAAFTTDSKDTTCIGPEGIKKVADAVAIPTVAIGGISLEKLSQLQGTGIAGVAIIRGIFGRDDIEGECIKLLKEVREIL